MSKFILLIDKNTGYNKILNRHLLEQKTKMSLSGVLITVFLAFIILNWLGAVNAFTCMII